MPSTFCHSHMQLCNAICCMQHAISAYVCLTSRSPPAALSKRALPACAKLCTLLPFWGILSSLDLSIYFVYELHHTSTFQRLPLRLPQFCLFIFLLQHMCMRVCLKKFKIALARFIMPSDNAINNIQ